MDEKTYEDSNAESKPLVKKSLSQRYPYLTAFVGFVA